MILQSLCAPSILYLGFSITQIIIDIYKKLYNTAFVKFIVMIIFTLFLNILCNIGLTPVSWIIVFIPFISMTIITTLLLFVFGLNPSTGIDDNSTNIRNTDRWRVLYEDGSFEHIEIINNRFFMFNQSLRIRDTNPKSFTLSNGITYTVYRVNRRGIIGWETDDESALYKKFLWIPVNNNNIDISNNNRNNNRNNDNNDYDNDDYNDDDNDDDNINDDNNNNITNLLLLNNTETTKNNNTEITKKYTNVNNEINTIINGNGINNDNYDDDNNDNYDDNNDNYDDNNDNYYNKDNDYADITYYDRKYDNHDIKYDDIKYDDINYYNNDDDIDYN